MKKLVIILLIALAAIILIFGLKLFSVTSDYNAKLEAQVPHLQIVTPEPIIADSAFKVTAFAQLSDDSNQSVPFIRILKKEDGAYVSGKALKMAYLTDYTMMAPTQSGAYILELGGIEQPFLVQPIDASLHLLSDIIYSAQTYQINLETNSHGARQSIALENIKGELIQTINNGLEQDFSTGILDVMAPEAAGSYRLIYKNSIGEDITSLSIEVTQAQTHQ